MHSAVAPSQGSEASTSFSTITMSEVLRDLETSSKRRISDKHAAKLFEQWFRDLSVDKKFQSSSNFAEVKLKELTRSGPTANGNADFSTAEEANTETLRIAFAFELLDKLSNSRNSAAPLLRMIRNELLKAVYSGIEAEDLAGPRLNFLLDKTPLFVENQLLTETVHSINSRIQQAEKAARRDERRILELEEEVEHATARLEGYKLRIQTVESEFEHEREDRAKKESLLFQELQQLREKLLQGHVVSSQSYAREEIPSFSEPAFLHSASQAAKAAFQALPAPALQALPSSSTAPPAAPSAAQPSIQESGEGSQEAEKKDISSDISNFVMKEAFETSASMVQVAVEAVEDAYKMYLHYCESTRSLLLSSPNVRLLLERNETSTNLLEIPIVDLLLRWANYHLRVVRSQDNFFQDWSSKFRNIQDVDELSLLQIVLQILPDEAKPQELRGMSAVEVKGDNSRALFPKVSQMLSLLTSDPKWLSSDFSSVPLRAELLMLLMVTTNRLDGSLYGKGKDLYTREASLNELLDKVRDNHRIFKAKMPTVVTSNSTFDKTSAELMLQDMKAILEQLQSSHSDFLEVHQELHEQVRLYTEIQRRGVYHLQERSNYKAWQLKEWMSTQGSPRDKSAGSQQGNRRNVLDFVPGKLNPEKLTKEMRRMISNISLEKLDDLVKKMLYHEAIQGLEKCAELTVTHYSTLRKVFRYYCKLYRKNSSMLESMGGATMSISAWELLLRDAYILEEGEEGLAIKPLEANQVFLKTLIRLDPRKGQASVDELEVNDLIEALIRLALILSTRTEQSLPLAYERIVRNIKTFGNKEETEHFRSASRAPAVHRVFLNYSTMLLQIFQDYSSKDTTDLVEDSSMVMNLKEFMQFVQDMKVMDNNLTVNVIINIFIYVQDDSSAKDEQPYLTSGDDEREMDYIEFREALCGIACYKILDPYLTLAQKLETLVVNHMLPNLVK
mmetsp:Transcript_3756/g.13461  ORF Transcript_3756/g.13461 Transcript_3756/m.13461 type:complete len:959 (+) Transcript_3756:729-3605(+)